ncbi:hypothetical protein DBR06_SOUSAS17610044, partial [Sousa chinensis]
SFLVQALRNVGSGKKCLARLIFLNNVHLGTF